MEAKEIVTQLTFLATEPLPKKDKVLIEVNHVESPHKIFFNVLEESYEDVFKPIMESLQFSYRCDRHTYAIPKSRLRIGLLCIVRHHDVFFRAVILQKTPDFVAVRTIDYGEMVKIKRLEYNDHPLYWLRQKFASMPIQALCGKLKFLQPKQDKWTKAASERLMDLLQNREVYAIIIKRGYPGDVVELCLECRETNENIEKKLVEEGHAIFVTASHLPAKHRSAKQDLQATVAVAGDGKPLPSVGHIISALDNDSESGSEDEVDAGSNSDGSISVHVYTSESDHSVDGNDGMAAFKSVDVVPAATTVSESSSSFAEAAVVVPSEHSTVSVSAAGDTLTVPASSINLEARERERRKIREEMKLLERKLAELNQRLDADSEDGASLRQSSSSKSASPISSTKMPKDTNGILNASAQPFIPRFVRHSDIGPRQQMIQPLVLSQGTGPQSMYYSGMEPPGFHQPAVYAQRERWTTVMYQPPGMIQPPPGVVQPPPGMVQPPPGMLPPPGMVQPPPGMLPCPGMVPPPPGMGPSSPAMTPSSQAMVPPPPGIPSPSPRMVSQSSVNVSDLQSIQPSISGPQPLMMSVGVQQQYVSSLPSQPFAGGSGDEPLSYQSLSYDETAYKNAFEYWKR